MITLYHAPRSRSSSILWLLEEIGEPYRVEIIPIVYGNGQGHPAPDSYRAIHPHKKVPAIDHDGVVVFESAAIALYLADAFPKAGLAPAIGDKHRGAYVTWLAYWTGVMNPVITARFRGWDNDAPTGFGNFEDMEGYIAATLAKHSYIAGDSFTAADVLVGGALGFFKGSLFPDREVYDTYLGRVSTRPARQRAIAKDNG
ncbi:MAG: glutathione S-transferase [Rhizomicrobium sp.]|jgi:glutathione S-transferase